jgi:hypothetical protein
MTCSPYRQSTHPGLHSSPAIQIQPSSGSRYHRP